MPKMYMTQQIKNKNMTKLFKAKPIFWRNGPTPPRLIFQGMRLDNF